MTETTTLEGIGLMIMQVRTAKPEDVDLRATDLTALFARITSRIAELEAMLDCRAGRLLLKGATFIVIKDDEPYYCFAYAVIREHELEAGTWTDRDEEIWSAQCHGCGEPSPTVWSYQQACKAIYKHRARADSAEQRIAELEAMLSTAQQTLQALGVTLI